MSMANTKFSPIVVGLPRSGFSLLASILIHFFNKVPNKFDHRCSALRLFCNTFGSTISKEIISTFVDHGEYENLIFNNNFRNMMGGPIWSHDEKGRRAYFRKYIGVRNKGDFTLITSHPLEILDQYEIIHSHGPFSSWLDIPEFPNYQYFASIRNPAGIINSACHSINALASEYMQINDLRDQENIRTQLAQYKLTDLTFFDCLMRPLKSGLIDQISTHNKYYTVFWEDVVTRPIETMKKIAMDNDIKVSDMEIEQIWQTIGFRNLTGDHKHNYRVGKAYVGDEQESLTNQHIDILKANGFDDLCGELGYGKLEYYDESKYTDFQKQTSNAIDSNKVLNPLRDKHLFDLAFNKSNIDFSKFNFRSHGWQNAVRVERSSLDCEKLEIEVAARADMAVLKINTLVDLLCGVFTGKNTFSEFSREVNSSTRYFSHLDTQKVVNKIEEIIRN